MSIEPVVRFTEMSSRADINRTLINNFEIRFGCRRFECLVGPVDLPVHRINRKGQDLGFIYDLRSWEHYLALPTPVGLGSETSCGTSTVREKILLKRALNRFLKIESVSDCRKFAREFGPLGLDRQDPDYFWIDHRRMTPSAFQVCERVDKWMLRVSRIRFFAEAAKRYDPFQSRRSEAVLKGLVRLSDFNQEGFEYRLEKDPYTPDLSRFDQRGRWTHSDLTYKIVKLTLEAQLKEEVYVDTSELDTNNLVPKSLYAALCLYLYQSAYLNLDVAGSYVNCKVCGEATWESANIAGRKDYCGDSCRKLVERHKSLEAAQARWNKLHQNESQAKRELYKLIAEELKKNGAKRTLAHFKSAFEG